MTFTATDMSRGTRQETGADINCHEVGALLDHMGIPANRRDYRRRMDASPDILPTWIEVADSQTVSQIRLPTPIV